MDALKQAIVSCTIILVGLFQVPTIAAQTTNTSSESVDKEQKTPLTSRDVKHYIKTSLAECKLQMEMKAHANQYDDVIKEFYKKRKNLLQDKGWTVENYEATQQRIFATQSSLEFQSGLESDEEFQKELDEIKANTYLTEEQRAQMIEAQKASRQARVEQLINPWKADWPVVKAYQKELKHALDFCNGNRPDPPVLDW